VIRVLFVCLGNICRSPAAEAVLRAQAESAKTALDVDSAGTGDWHVGELADARMRGAGARRGYQLRHRARQIAAADFARFDLIITMDDANYRQVLTLAPDADAGRKVRKFCSFCSTHALTEVPDPYYGGADGFELVLDILEDGCRGILASLTPARQGG
jgi:protein-tyrosine phosphatase